MSASAMLLWVVFPYVSMAVFVVFVCGFSKWLLNRKKAKCDVEPVHGGQAAATAEPAKGHDGK